MKVGVWELRVWGLGQGFGFWNYLLKPESLEFSAVFCCSCAWVGPELWVDCVWLWVMVLYFEYAAGIEGSWLMGMIGV